MCLGLRNKYGGKFFSTIVNGLSSEGYDVYSKVIDSSQYGVPQIRKGSLSLEQNANGIFPFPNLPQKHMELSFRAALLETLSWI